jgi:hypothetical protein
VFSIDRKFTVRPGFVAVVVLFILAGLLVQKHFNEYQNETSFPLSIEPMGIPADSADTHFYLSVNPYQVSGRLSAKIGDTPIPLRGVEGIIPGHLSSRPRHLRFVLTSSDGTLNDSAQINVFAPRHQADLRIEGPKAPVKLEEVFSIGMTLTNRSGHPVYVKKRVDWDISGTGFDPYHFEIRPSFEPVPYIPIQADVLGFGERRTTQELLAAGEIVALAAGESHKVTVDDLSLESLLGGFGSPFNPPRKGAYVLRLRYEGLPSAIGTFRVASLDQRVYSNPIEIILDD